MNKIYFTPLLLAITQPCLAVEEISSKGKSHTLEIQLGLGSVDTETASEKDDKESVSGFIYGYKYNSNLTINMGVVSGETYCIITCPQDWSSIRTLEYDSYILNAKGSLLLSNRWSVFGKLGANYYNLEFSGENRASATDTGVGALLATGFDFRAYNGFGLGFEIAYLDMGNISAENYTLNFSYMF